MPTRRCPDWESAVISPAAAPAAGSGPVAFCADLSPPSVLAAYRRGIVPLPAADEYFRTVNEVRYSAQVADGTIALVGPEDEDPYWASWWSPDPRPVIGVGGVHLGRNLRKQLRRGDEWTTADAAFGRVAEECRAEREPRWLTDTLLRSLAELHSQGWVHSIEVWQDGDLIGGAFGVAIGRVLSGDSLFGRRGGAARIAVADMAARFGQADGLLIDAQWDSPFLRSLGAGPMPRERYLPLLADAGRPAALPSQPLPARRLLTIPSAPNQPAATEPILGD